MMTFIPWLTWWGNAGWGNDGSTTDAPPRLCPSCGKPEHGSLPCESALELIYWSPQYQIWRQPVVEIPYSTGARLGVGGG